VITDWTLFFCPTVRTLTYACRLNRMLVTELGIRAGLHRTRVLVTCWSACLCGHYVWSLFLHCNLVFPETWFL